ncbi:MAG: hypothetical protein WAW77_07980, partial [Caldibacillus thermoamylovorans]
KEDYSESSKMYSHFLRAVSIRGSKSVLIAGRSSLYVAKRALCAFLIAMLVDLKGKFERF